MKSLCSPRRAPLCSRAPKQPSIQPSLQLTDWRERNGESSRQFAGLRPLVPHAAVLSSLACSHPPVPWASLCPLLRGACWFYSALALSHSLTCREQLSLFVGLGGCNGPERREAWQGGPESRGAGRWSWTDTPNMPSEAMWLKLFGAS